MEDKPIVSQENIENRIYTIRGKQVMLDRDLAELYQVKVKRLNEQVKRNTNRFPEKFMFRLTDTEKDELVAKCDRYNSMKHSSVNPNVFTEQGVAMLSAILRSEIAVKISIQIMDAFVQMRKLVGRENLQQLRITNMEDKILEHDLKINKIFDAIEQNELPKRGIFFNGQVFDAYQFTSKIIRSAKSSIILIDNYIDETTLTHLSKKKKNVEVLLLSKRIKAQLKLDVEKANQQYGNFTLKKFKQSHDRFLIIDKKEVYHIGASLKDLGLKWFAFSKMDTASIAGILERIEEFTFYK